MVQTSPIQSTRFTFVGGSTADNLTAVSPATQATALGLTAQTNRITTAAAGAAVALPATVGAAGAWNLKGCAVTVINATANDIVVYPANGSGDTINGLSSTAGVIVPAQSVEVFAGATGFDTANTGNWYTLGASGGNGPIDGNLQVVSAAGSNSQSGAVAVLPGNVIVATVSATTRAIRLSGAGTNKSYAVFNDTATKVKCYPVTNGTIGSAATNVAVQVGAHAGSIFLYRNGLHVGVMGVGGV